MRLAEPRVVGRRRERLSAGGTTGTSSVTAKAALQSVGFDTVGDVMGAVAIRAQPSGFFSFPGGGHAYPTGWQGAAGTDPPVFSSSSAPRIPSRISALRDGYRVALARLVDELRARDADGAVGVHVEHTRVEEGELHIWQFLATGTALRTRGIARAHTPFTAALSASGTASAIRAGWVPVAYLSRPVMTARWVEPESQRRMRRRSANGEVTAFAEAVQRCREDAARELAREARAVGADAAVLESMSLDVVPDRALAQVAVRVTGTALARFAVPPRDPHVLTVLPLGRSGV